MAKLDNTYRNHMAECHHRAANATNENEKSRWLRIASEWEKLIAPNLDPADTRAEDEHPGITNLSRKPDLLELINLLNDSDIREIEE